MTDISIAKNETQGGWNFNVVLSENSGSTNHKVTMQKDFYENLKTEQLPEEVVKKSFEFLLEKESKDAILSEFDITLIGKYFPEYPKKIREVLG